MGTLFRSRLGCKKLFCIPPGRADQNQGGRKTYDPTDGDNGTECTFPVEFNTKCIAFYCSYLYQQNHVVSGNFDNETKFRIWAKNINGTRVAATLAYIAYGI